jgi:hypothetical protein
MAAKVVAKLGLLPLAIIQAGSFISRGQMSFHQYLALLDKGFKAVAAKGAPGQWDPRTRSATLLNTWEMSFSLLTSPAQELLLLCGLLANGDIPDELFNLEGEMKFDWMKEGM